MIKSQHPEGPVVIVTKDIEYAFPLGIAYLAGYLRKYNEDVRVLLRPQNRKLFGAFAKKLLELKPLVVGFGSLYPDLYPIKEIVSILDRLGRRFPVVIGGQMVSPIPEFAVSITGADCGVIGEGEIIFYNLVQALRGEKDISEVKGLMVRSGDTLRSTGPGEFIENLSDLPAIPYDLFPEDKWLHVGKFYTRLPVPHWYYNDRVITIHGARGCPYSCNFCYHSNKARYRDIPEMFADTKELINRYDANMLYFEDDLVLSTPARAQQIATAVSELGEDVEYSVSSRFDILSRMDDQLLRKMKESGCRIMGLGIESGSQRILDVMEKKITVDQITTGLSRLKKAGILPTVSIMVGQLTETREDISKSMDVMVKAARENKYIHFAFTIATPFPGSELYSLAMKSGLLKNDLDFFQRFKPNRLFSGVSVNFTKLPDRELVCFRNRLERTFLKESLKSKGLPVICIEFLRFALAFSVGALLNSISVDLFFRGKRKMITRQLQQGYDYIQTVLDKFRLNLLGLR